VAYDNEEHVGAALLEARVEPKQSHLITTKIMRETWVDRCSIVRRLAQKLQMDYVDPLLPFSPDRKRVIPLRLARSSPPIVAAKLNGVKATTPSSTWRKMKRTMEVQPAVNQVEMSVKVAAAGAGRVLPCERHSGAGLHTAGRGLPVLDPSGPRNETPKVWRNCAADYAALVYRLRRGGADQVCPRRPHPPEPKSKTSARHRRHGPAAQPQNHPTNLTNVA